MCPTPSTSICTCLLLGFPEECLAALSGLPELAASTTQEMSRARGLDLDILQLFSIPFLLENEGCAFLPQC